jgi:SAM-dependent methyltransferase
MGLKTRIRTFFKLLKSWNRGRKLADSYVSSADRPTLSVLSPKNDLREFFDRNVEGPGIWKWEHYFEIYDRHLSKFRGKAPTIVEIGIYSGGSLPMWQHYFGPGTQVVGIDIEPACRVYEREGVRVFIGDQADRSFWARFREEVPKVDILIDDGGHESEQQSISLDEMLPHLAPGGVYICEDVHHKNNLYARMVFGLADGLNDFEWMRGDPEGSGRWVKPTTALQKSVKGISVYPYVTVFELHDTRPMELVSVKHGTEWQPFL